MSTESPQAFMTPGSGGAGDGAQHAPGDAADTARGKAEQAAGQAQEKTQQAAGRAQDMLREQIDQRSGQAAEQINAQASDLRSVGDALRQEGKDGPADAAHRLAGYAEKVGHYLQETDSHALLADAEDFGRQRPWAAAAGGLALGLAASRFLKASSARRYQTRTPASGSGQTGRSSDPVAGQIGRGPGPGSDEQRPAAGSTALPGSAVPAVGDGAADTTRAY